MPGSPILPKTAPFAEEQIAVLNTVMSNSTADQRTWLSGFLAGFAAANDSSAIAPVPAPSPARRAPLTILFGTESGNAEALAAQARKVATKLGFAPKAVDMADISMTELAALDNVLIVASTWGEGDPPQRAVDFQEALLADDAPRLDKLRYAVLALGDRAYAQFCEVGKRFDDRFAALGATRVADRLDCDVDFETAANAWIEATLPVLKPADEPTENRAVIHVDFARPAVDGPTRTTPFVAAVTEHVRLTGSRSTSDTHHIELSLEGSGIAYEPGDALGVIPQNDPALADAVLAASGLSGNDALRSALIERLDITTLTVKQVEDFGTLTGFTAAPGWSANRQMLDLLEAGQSKLTAEQLTGLLRPLPPRYYSIASSRKAVGEEAHLLVAALRYEAHGRARQGVASIDLTAGKRDRMQIFLRANRHFRLPADPNRPVIMIGPGTGIAPFRGFLQEREALGGAGKNWLVFGHRNFTHDFLYQLEIQDWLKSGVLNRLDVAFSRDQPQKYYVQDAMWARRSELAGWLRDGAALYVCGDMNAMARDVHATLLRILEDQGASDAKTELDGIRRDGRYLRDVY
ncbi:MAG: flavodoxin domain-containing protein [Rhodospirillales bacterium]